MGRLDSWQKRLTLLGFFLGISLAITLLLLGIAGLPFTGGASLLPLFIAMPLFALSVTGRCCSIGNYIGKAFDTVFDKNKSNNEKIAAVVGCLLGIVIACLAFPLHFVRTDLIMTKVEMAVSTLSFMFVPQVIGTLASRCANIGKAFDALFKNKTIFDIFRWIKNKCWNAPQAANDKKEDLDLYEIVKPSLFNRIKYFFTERLQEAPWQKTLNVLGLAVGIGVAVACLVLGIAAVPFSGGASLLPAWAAATMFFLMVTGSFAAVGSYVGKSIDTVLDKNKSTNEKIASVCGCLLGVGVAIAAFPLHFTGVDFITKSANVATTIIGIVSTVITIGNFTSWCSNIGKAFDAATGGKTIVDACQWAKQKITAACQWISHQCQCTKQADTAAEPVSPVASVQENMPERNPIKESVSAATERAHLEKPSPKATVLNLDHITLTPLFLHRQKQRSKLQSVAIMPDNTGTPTIKSAQLVDPLYFQYKAKKAAPTAPLPQLVENLLEEQGVVNIKCCG